MPPPAGTRGEAALPGTTAARGLRRVLTPGRGAAPAQPTGANGGGTVRVTDGETNVPVVCDVMDQLWEEPPSVSRRCPLSAPEAPGNLRRHLRFFSPARRR
ncbi:hypothetical protein GCM10010417_26440 [Streptomyces carpaticus]